MEIWEVSTIPTWKHPSCRKGKCKEWKTVSEFTTVRDDRIQVVDISCMKDFGQNMVSLSGKTSAARPCEEEHQLVSSEEHLSLQYQQRIQKQATLKWTSRDWRLTVKGEELMGWKACESTLSNRVVWVANPYTWHMYSITMGKTRPYKLYAAVKVKKVLAAI